MKLLVFAGLLALSTAASAANSCKMALYGEYGEYVATMRTGNDPQCMKAMQACRNWKVWYVLPQGARCIKVVDDGVADIDYIRFPDYDNYYGYPGSPYSRVPRTQPTTTTTVCQYDRYGREVCYDQPTAQPGTNRVCQYINGAQVCWTEGSTTTTTTTQVCEEYSDGTERCWYEPTTTNTTPAPRPNPRPNPTTTPAPRPNPTTIPAPRPNPTTTPAPRPNPTTTPAPRPNPTTIPAPRPNPTTTPTPVPNPTPTTTPTPAPGSTDTTRAIEAGETVIFNSTLHMVVSVPNPNFYNLKPVNGRNNDIIKDVARQYVAVTRGCNMGFCATDSVIVLATASYAAVAGLEYDGQFVLKAADGSNNMTFDVNGNGLAWTKGCTPEGPAKVCVGAVVMKQSSRNNGYYTVVGIQLDGNVVIENNDAPKKLTLNIRPDSLIITR